MSVEPVGAKCAREVAVVIRTERFSETLAFYRQALGLEVGEQWYEGGRGAVLRLSAGVDLEILELGAPGEYGGVAVGLEVDDVDAWYDRVVRQGATPNAPPVDAFRKRGFGVSDPNGVPVNVYTTFAPPDVAPK